MKKRLQKTLVQSFLASLLICAIFHVGAQVSYFLPMELARTDTTRDFIAYWSAASAALQQQPIYYDQRGYTPASHPFHGYVYPPPFAAALSPLGALPPLVFARLCILGSIAAFWAFAYALAKLSSRSNKATWKAVIGWGLVLCLWPGTYKGISLGQVDIALQALFALGLASAHRSNWWSIAPVVKVFYAWPLLIEAAAQWKSGPRKAVKVLWPSAAIITALIALGGFVCGWDSYSVWAQTVLPSLSQGNFNPDNVSLSFGVLRLLEWSGLWKYSGGPTRGAAHLWLSSAAIAGPALTWWLLRRAEFHVKCAVVTALSAICAPVAWSTYLPIILPFIALCWAQIAERAKNLSMPVQNPTIAEIPISKNSEI